MKKFWSGVLLIVFTGLQIVYAAPENDSARLIRENRNLREKLLAVEKELAEYRVWLAGLGIDHQKITVPDREKRLLHILNELMQRGNSLSVAAHSVRDECRRLLTELPLGPVRKAQVELRLDELDRAAGTFAAITVPGDAGAGNCRVLAIEKNLKVVVLSAGFGSGVFPGMIFTAKRKKTLKLRVISVRFEGSLAELVSGDWQELVPGMEMSALHQSPSTRRSILSL